MALAADKELPLFSFLLLEWFCFNKHNLLQYSPCWWIDKGGLTLRLNLYGPPNITVRFWLLRFTRADYRESGAGRFYCTEGREITVFLHWGSVIEKLHQTIKDTQGVGGHSLHAHTKIRQGLAVNYFTKKNKNIGNIILVFTGCNTIKSRIETCGL